MIELHCLGTAEIRGDCATITPSQEIVFATALYLILAGGRPVSRTRLASLIWPGADDRTRAHRLRQTLHQLKQLRIPARSDRNVLSLPREEVLVDVDRLSAIDFTKLKTPELVEFLPGYTPRFSEQFRDWVEAQRDVVHAELTRNLLSALRLARSAGDWPSVERISNHCLRLDRYNEAAVLARAEAFAMRGQKATALSLLDEYVQEVGRDDNSLMMPATVLRKRVLQHVEGIPSTSQEPAFVGRGIEMAALSRLVENARRGEGGVFLLHGEPGIGKTRLSSEVATFAELQGVGVERIACKRADIHQPLSAFVTLVPALLDRPGAIGCSDTNLGLLRRLIEFDDSTQQSDPAEDSRAVYTRLRSAVVDLLDAVSYERCLLIVIEDVQWIDEASAQLLAAMVEGVRSKKIFMLFTSRSATTRLTETASKKDFPVHHLGPLSTSDAETIIRSILKPSCESEGLPVEWLVNAGDGNPFFIQELTKNWIETGEQRSVPQSVASVLDDRLSRLSAVARQLLQACAVLAEHSTIERLEQVLEYRSYELLEGMQELSASGMLRCLPASSSTAQSVIVRHDLLSSQVMKTLAPVSLALLHRRSGIALEREALGPSISTSLLRACAFHWHRAGDSDRAYRLAIKCADHLLEIGLASDAAAAYEGALTFSSTIDGQREVAARVIQANKMARDWGPMISAIGRFRSLQSSVSPAHPHDDLEVLEFEARRTSEAAIASLFSHTLLCVYDESLTPDHRVKVAVVAVKLASGIPDLNELGRVYECVRPLLDLSSVAVRDRLQILVVYNTMCGDLRQAVGFAKERVAFERAEGSSLLLSNAMSDLAFVLRRVGPFEEMISVLREAYDTAIREKHYATARECAGRIAALVEDTHLDSSQGTLEEWMELGLAASVDHWDPHNNFSLNASLARAALQKGRVKEARQILETEFDWDWLAHRGSWHAAALALRVRLLMAEQSKVADIAPDLVRLRDLFPRFAGLGGQDYEVATLCDGLVYVGEQTLAQHFFGDYTLNRRRDLTEFSQELNEAAISASATKIKPRIALQEIARNDQTQQPAR